MTIRPGRTRPWSRPRSNSPAPRLGQGMGADERETIVGNVLQMQESGTQDLTALLVWVVKLLGDHPVWIDRVGSSMVP